MQIVCDDDDNYDELVLKQLFFRHVSFVLKQQNKTHFFVRIVK